MGSLESAGLPNPLDKRPTEFKKLFEDCRHFQKFGEIAESYGGTAIAPDSLGELEHILALIGGNFPPSTKFAKVLERLLHGTLENGEYKLGERCLRACVVVGTDVLVQLSKKIPGAPVDGISRELATQLVLLITGFINRYASLYIVCSATIPALDSTHVMH